jgi:hypothetical protein
MLYLFKAFFMAKRNTSLHSRRANLNSRLLQRVVMWYEYPALILRGFLDISNFQFFFPNSATPNFELLKPLDSGGYIPRTIQSWLLEYVFVFRSPHKQSQSVGSIPKPTQNYPSNSTRNILSKDILHSRRDALI